MDLNCAAWVFASISNANNTPDEVKKNAVFAINAAQILWDEMEKYQEQRERDEMERIEKLERQEGGRDE